MKVIKNTLEVCVDTWEDPGDYPCGAGSGPLPSYSYISEVEGEVHVEISPEELEELKKWIETAEFSTENSNQLHPFKANHWVYLSEILKQWVEPLDIELPNGILSVKWCVEIRNVGDVVNYEPPKGPRVVTEFPTLVVLNVVDFEIDSNYQEDYQEEDYPDYPDD